MDDQSYIDTNDLTKIVEVLHPEEASDIIIRKGTTEDVLTEKDPENNDKDDSDLERFNDGNFTEEEFQKEFHR